VDIFGEAAWRLGRRALALRRSRVRAAAVALTLLAGCEVADPDPAKDVLTDLDWPAPTTYTHTPHRYGPDPLHTLDLYRPRGITEANPPVIVYLHGGGWTGGDKDELVAKKPLGRSIVAQLREGFVVVSANYRLAFTDPFPAAVLDVKRAVRWLHTLPGYERSPVVLAGSSAGGNLAVMAAVSAGVPWLEPDETGRTDVRAAVSLDGPVDLDSMQSQPWFTTSWAFFGSHEPGTANYAHFGPHLETGELVPAYLGCTDAQITGDPPRLSPGCQQVVDRQIANASARTFIGPDDPPLYLACITPAPTNLHMVPDCHRDHRPFANAYIANHGGDGNTAWIDQLDQPGANHFAVDTHLNFAALKAFLNRFRT
jgi:acetyl esterase/lipase